MKVKMVFSPVVYYFVLFILLDVAVKSQMSNSNSHGFLQGDNEVRYIVDSMPVSVHKEFSNSPGVKVQSGDENTNGYLQFDPPLLDFKERHLGDPSEEKVTIINHNGNKTVHMSSISGSTVHFHSSFFEDKLIPPLGNTTFTVVFLGREEGEIESNLFIHTSEGSFKYQVRGSSLQSPYRLRPLAGVRLPLNASFSSLILMHNPYPTPLQLVEVYGSGGGFHLELPSGEFEGNKHLWEIPAFLTKPIIRVRFHARAQKNHTAYIRLKVNTGEALVLPLEVEVGAACGLYTPVDVIDFGIGGSYDSPTSVNVLLQNSWKKPIKIQNVISTPVSKALKIDFQPIKVPPETDEPVKVAQLTFDWAVALETGHTSGRIVVKSKQSMQKLVIPYTATVLAGGLSYDGEVTRFRSDSPNNPPRIFQLTNHFKLPIAITNVSLPKDAQPYFELSQFEPCILQPEQTAPLFQLIPSSETFPHLTLDSTIIINTNVSTLVVPLLCYDGKLTKMISHRNESELELGTVGSGTEKQIVFALVNENPVPVTILSWETSLPSTSVALASIQDNDPATYLSQYSPHNNVTEERSVGPGQYAVVRVLVRAGAQVGETQGHVTLRTQYETIQIAAHMRVEHGSLQVTPDPIIFDNCFPGKVCTEMLRVQSLFSVAMAVTGVSGISGDPRLNFSPAAPPLLPPATTTTLGSLSFDTRLLSPEDNYLATTHNVTGGTRWQDTLELPAHCPDFDLSLLRARYEHYRNLSSRLLNLTLRLDTTEVREHIFGARVRLKWPQLARDLTFPLTQVGNTTQRSLVLTNPGTQEYIMIQLVLDSTYPATATLLDNMPPQLKPEVVPGTGQFEVDAGASEYRVTGHHIHRDTWTFLLPPSANTSVIIRFTPTDAHFSSALLFIRNNLTVLETLQLTGTGAYAQFKFGNRKPGSATPLLFELAEKHLKDCEREKQRKFPAPNLTVKRSFTARNTGALPISVHGFHISGLSCEGYGFRVLNCEAFSLPPNSTRKVDIAFTPDFTLARVQRTLGVWTSESDSAANYTLVATLPPFLLSTCSIVLARPAWEPLLYYCAVTFMVFLLVCVLAAAFLESNRALKCALLAMSRDTASTQPVLDLKTIGTGVGPISSNSISGNSSSSGLSSNPSSSSEKSDSSWSKTPPLSSSSTPTSTPTAPQEPEVVKEKYLKTEVESVAGVFSSPPSKCVKRKEKTIVSKRFSDPTDIVGSERRSSWGIEFTKPLTCTLPKSQPKSVIVTSPEPIKSSSSESKRKLTKRNSNPGRCVRDVTSLPVTSLCSSVGEDTETSSTTTESSHDDGDKEVEVTMALRECDSGSTTNHKTQRLRGPKSESIKKTSPPIVIDRNAGSASSLEHEWEDDEPVEKEPLLKKTHSNSRSRKSSSKISKSSESCQSGQSGNRSKNSLVNKQTNSRTKEKQTLVQKRSFEKLPSLPKPVAFEPPPPPLGLWDESRASFSDVVARSDATKHTLDQPLHPLNTQAPQISTSPPTLLGPIGSKKTYPSVWDHWNDNGELNSAPPPNLAPAISTPSFFRDTFSDTRPSPVIQNTSFDAGWAEQNMALKMLQEQQKFETGSYQQQQHQQQRAAYHDTWSSLWETIYSGNVPTSDSTPAPTTTSNASSLWGNNVWAPPPPPDTWAPPGLAPRPPPRIDDPEVDIGLDYDLFRSLSNIWAPPHSSNTFWKPPTTNNN